MWRQTGVPSWADLKGEIREQRVGGRERQRGHAKELKGAFQIPRLDLKPSNVAGILPSSVRTVGLWGRHRVCSNEESRTQPRRSNRVVKACSPFIHLSQIKSGICHRFCKRLEANDPRVRNGRSVGRVDGTRVERPASL